MVAVNYDVEDDNQVVHAQTKLYGLLPENIIETYDGAAEYKNPNKRDAEVKELQTATSLTGFALLESEINNVESAQVISGTGAGDAVNLKKQNPVCSWYAKDEFDENVLAEKCGVKFTRKEAVVKVYGLNEYVLSN